MTTPPWWREKVIILLFFKLAVQDQMRKKMFVKFLGYPTSGSEPDTAKKNTAHASNQWLPAPLKALSEPDSAAADHAVPEHHQAVNI